MSNTAEHKTEVSTRRFGWSAMACWSTLGFLMEAAHAFKFAPFLDDDMVRLMLRLAHAHGTLFGLVTIVFGATSHWMNESVRRSAARALMIGALVLPLGFALGAIATTESDPGPGVLLAPLGAVACLFALVRIAAHSFAQHIRREDAGAGDTTREKSIDR